MKNLFIIFVVCLATLTFVGCSKEEAVRSSGEAIEVSKSIETPKDKLDYLIKQANYFYKSEDFQQTINITQYILTYLNSDSEEARELLEKSKFEILKKVEEGLDRAYEKFLSKV